MKTKNLILILLLLTQQLIFPAHIFGQDKDASSLLWEISGNGLEQPSYIFGTVHVICSEDFVMSEEARKALSVSEVLVLELDMDDPQMIMKMAQLSLSRSGTRLSEFLTEDQLQQLNVFLQQNYGLNVQTFNMVKPVVLYSLVLNKSLPCDKPVSFEEEFLKMAKKDSIPVEGLEEVEYQMALFDSIPMRDQVNWIVEGLDSVKMKEELSKMVDLYKRQNVDSLYAMITETPEYEDYIDMLLHNRNQHWVSKIVEIIHQRPAFIAVGAGHLGSEKGLITLLRGKGYTLKPVR